MIIGAAVGAIIGAIFVVISCARHERRSYEQMRAAQMQLGIATAIIGSMMRDGAARCHECYVELGPHYVERGLALVIENGHATFWCEQHKPAGDYTTFQS